MKSYMKHLLALVMAMLLFVFTACGAVPPTSEPEDTYTQTEGSETFTETEGPEAFADTETPETFTETEAPEVITETEIPEAFTETDIPETESKVERLDENGSYNSKDEVALYIHQYGKLPSNYISKKDAEALGWSGGSLEPYAPGKSIGGSRFGNYEGILPEAEGRRYTECDIDTLGKKKRGAKRIVFSNDGLIYYTEDHYETFELLYGEE